MGFKTGTAAYWEFVLMRAIPIFIAVMSFVLISPWTTQYTWIPVSPQVVLYGWGLVWIGFGFIIEMMYSLPDTKGSRGASFGAVLFGGFSLASFVLGGLVITGKYVFDNTSINTGISLLYLLAIGMFIWMAREEVFRGRKLHEKFQSSFG